MPRALWQGHTCGVTVPCLTSVLSLVVTPTGPTASALAVASATEDDPQARAALRARFIEAATAAGRAGRLQTGVRWWLKYVVFGRQRVPWTECEQMGSLQVKIDAENLLVDFAIWLATCRPSGRPISARTVLRYTQQVRRWHLQTFRTELCGGLDNSVITAACKGAAALVTQPRTIRRWGVRTQDLCKAMEQELAKSGEDVMWRAALSVGFCALMRGCELARQPAEAFSTIKHLTRADVRFRRSRATGEMYAVLTMRVGKTGTHKEREVIIGSGGSMVDALQALIDMERADPIADPLERARTPLFRRADGSAITVGQLRRVIKTLMERLGLDPRRFGAHSLRIGGATAALAAGLSPAAIRAAGRWGSDVYTIYTRLSRESAFGLTAAIGSSAFEDVERSVAFVDEELTFTTEEMLPGDISFLERSDIDAVMADEEEDWADGDEP